MQHRRRAPIVLAAIVSVAFTGTLRSETRSIADSLSSDLGSIVADPVRPRMYLLDRGTDELVVLDSNREDVLRRFPLSSPVRDLAIDKSRQRLVVAAEHTLGVLDLSSLSYSESPVPSGVIGRLMSIAFHSSGALFAGANRNPPGWSPSVEVFVLSPDVTEVVGSFRRVGQPHYFYYPLLRTDATGNVLLVLEQYLSRSAPYALDVTHPVHPSLIGGSNTSVGANCRDLAISQDRPEIYVACGYPYGLVVVEPFEAAEPALLPTGPYPTAVTVGPTGESLMLGPSSVYNDFLYQFSATTRQLIARYPLTDETTGDVTEQKGLALDRTGRKAFVVRGSSWHDRYYVQVVDVARAILAGVAPSGGRGWARKWGKRLRVVIPSLSVADGDRIDLNAPREYLGRVVTLGPLNARPLPPRVGIPRDMDYDGDRDLVFRFDLGDLGLDCGTSQIQLKVWGDSGDLEAFAFLDTSDITCD